jgi:hypothetical protein
MFGAFFGVRGSLGVQNLPFVRLLSFMSFTTLLV